MFLIGFFAWAFPCGFPQGNSPARWEARLILQILILTNTGTVTNHTMGVNLGTFLGICCRSLQILSANVS